MTTYKIIKDLGWVRPSTVNAQSALETVADMHNAHNPSLLAEIWGDTEGAFLGLAEVTSPVAVGALERELQSRGRAFAPASIFLGGKTEDGKWALHMLGDFTVLNAPKSFPGRPDRFPEVFLDDDGIRAFGLTKLSDIMSGGEVKAGVRFPVIKTGK